MKRQGILIICPFFRPNIGGVETHLDDLCEYLRTHTYQVCVLTYQPITTRMKGLTLERKENLEIRRYWWLGFNLFHKLEPYPILELMYLTPWLLLISFSFLFKNKGKIDVIHSHGLNAALIAKFLKLVFKKKVVTSIHAIYNLKGRTKSARIVKWILDSSDRVLTLSKQSKEELVRIGLQEERVEVYTYWINQEIFKPLDKNKCKEELGWEGKFVVLFVGRFIPVKGADILLEVAGKVNKGIYFAFVGDGPLAKAIERESEEVGNVLFVGKIDNRDLPLYYNSADILAIPSQYEEGFGRVILEALSCGCPVAGARKGGIPEAVDDSVGILVEPTVEELANVLQQLWSHPDVLEELRKNCRPYAERRFGLENAHIIEHSYRVSPGGQ